LEKVLTKIDEAQKTGAGSVNEDDTFLL